jgi:glycosyltransferase involved in cell wall biosynthesis
MQLRVLIPATLSHFSGGTRRLYHLLKIGHRYGVNYIFVIGKNQLKDSLKVYPDLLETLRLHSTYLIDSNIPTNMGTYGPERSHDVLRTGMLLAKIAKMEHPDIIVSPYEAPGYVLVSYLAGKFSRRPWTCVLQSVPILGLSIPILGNLNPIRGNDSIWWAFLDAQAVRNLKGKGIRMLEMMLTLKLLKKTLPISVSKSISHELKLFDPKLEFLHLDPPVGVDLEKLDKIKPNEHGFDAIFFSRLLSTKGLLDLPLIWKHVIQYNPNLTLAIAGPSPVPKDLITFFELVERYSLKKNIVYLGEQNWENMMAYLKASKIVVYPSLSDSFPMVVLESLACGLPVIAYNIPALRINYGHVSAVRLFPRDFKLIADEVIYLIENQKLRESLGDNARSFAQKYTWENVIKAEINAYKVAIDVFER